MSTVARGIRGCPDSQCVPHVGEREGEGERERESSHHIHHEMCVCCASTLSFDTVQMLDPSLVEVWIASSAS